LSEVRHIDLLAALMMTALEMAMLVFGMARVAPTLSPPAIAVRLVALPAPPPKPPDEAMPVIETEPPPRQPAAAPAMSQSPPAASAVKTRSPSPRREATHRSRRTGSATRAPTTSPPTETVPTRSVSTLGGGTMGARAIYRPLPEIPEEIRRRSATLVAVARFRIAADGAATVDLIQPTPDPRFNSALLATLRTWRFFPAMADGRPVASTVDIRIPISAR
jgi:periplasmic protein TonB